MNKTEVHPVDCGCGKCEWMFEFHRNKAIKFRGVYLDDNHRKAMQEKAKAWLKRKYTHDANLQPH